MIERRLVDTNILIRYFVQDDIRLSKQATQLIDACVRGDLILVVLPVVLAESVFVLESFYKRPRTLIGEVLITLISNPDVEIADLKIHQDALVRYGSSNLHFIDCVIAATAVAHRMSVATFDAGLQRLPEVKVELD